MRRVPKKGGEAPSEDLAAPGVPRVTDVTDEPPSCRPPGASSIIALWHRAVVGWLEPPRAQMAFTRPIRSRRGRKTCA